MLLSLVWLRFLGFKVTHRFHASITECFSSWFTISLSMRVTFYNCDFCCIYNTSKYLSRLILFIVYNFTLSYLYYIFIVDFKCISCKFFKIFIYIFTWFFDKFYSTLILIFSHILVFISKPEDQYFCMCICMRVCTKCIFILWYCRTGLSKFPGPELVKLLTSAFVSSLHVRTVPFVPK